MDWLKVTVLTTTQGAELVSQALIDCGASGGTQIEDKLDFTEEHRPAGMWDIMDPSLSADMREDVCVTAYYSAAWSAPDVLAHIRAELSRLQSVVGEDIPLGKLAIETGGIDDENWAEFWKKDYKPFRIGKHLVVKPGWEEYAPCDGDIVLEIDPGMAFGTGTHETTALCVTLIEEYMRPGDSVIDIGTGSGILAIAAVACGAKEALATDIDPLAVQVAEENALRNGCGEKITVRQGDLMDVVDRKAQIVVANIIADVICILAAPARECVEEGGVFICSGIAAEREEKVLRALEAAGFAAPDIRRKGEWVAMACRVGGQNA